ncbi:MAG: 2-oxo acid dehydrogenase subunit E2 [Streptomycetaceae bacterium]|nr:MAG: 2-oxo acid dehydrogenase subunit E2 [Streptomycetaceae bacterium]
MTDAEATIFDFLLPDVGEGLDEAEIVQWMVKVGQTIDVNQPMVEIETAKALVELPSPYAGTILELLVPMGEMVSVGNPIIRIQLSEPSAIDVKNAAAKTERKEILVGSGPISEESTTRRREPRNYGTSTPANTSLSDNKPTQDSRVTRTAIRGVRKAMADAMVTSAFSAPHVSEFITVDVTASMTLLEKMRMDPEFADIKLSPLTLLARAIAIAFPQTPEVNSSWDGVAHEIVTKHYLNLGIATATDRGLLVPNIKDAHELTVKELAIAIANLVDVTRDGRAEPQQLTGGTLSITNIGIFGIDTGTPILPPGEAVIVALGAVSDRPWVVNGEITIRAVTTISLSFDHRLVDGAQGSKFLSRIAQILHDGDNSELMAIS